MSHICLSQFLSKKEIYADHAFSKCFHAASEAGQAVIYIEPGEYHLEGLVPIPLCSNVHVIAKGATLYFPEDLGEHKRRFMFCGENIENFTWEGGKFIGYVHNPETLENKWEPEAHTVCIEICKSKKSTRNLTFLNMEAENIAGPVIHIRGEKDDLENRSFAENIDIRGCHFYNCGMVMWDYGYLWQTIVYASHYKKEIVEKAFRYMPSEVISSELSLKNGKLYADYMPQKMEEEKDTVTLFGENLPPEIKRGKRYYVVNEGAENGLLLSETSLGAPINITHLPSGTRLFRNMFFVFRLYTPVGADCRRKGAIDVTLCTNVNISECCFCAYGDSMHILECENAVFANNRILGARMGAFYIGFQCKNITVTGNTVYGTNGSRIVSVERESEDIIISGNTFFGGGRGAWFNHPKNIVISNNIFKRNTCKCDRNFDAGRICYATGEFEEYPELYFTTWQDNGEIYGPVVISSNIIETGDNASAAMAFNPGGKDILITGNIIRGKNRALHVAKGCEMPHMHNNIGIEQTEEKTFFNPANVK